MTSPKTRRFRPSLEALETRLVPATRVWDGGAVTSDRWKAAANWEDNALPVAGDDLVFPAGADRLSNLNDFAIGTEFGSITFTGSGYDIRGNRVVLTGGGIDASQQISGTNRLAINLTVTGSDNPVSVGFANFSGGVLILDNQVSGTAGLVKNGPGTLELAGSGINMFSGPMQVNAGTLRLN